jgi:hypothetical protein
MVGKDARPSVLERAPKRVQDLPGCIKYILLVLLILLLLGEIASGEFSRSRETGWLTWLILLIKLILIAGLIALIWVQKNLNCQITDPGSMDCVAEQIDAVAGTQFIKVTGTASGAVFGHYTLTISGPYSYTVTYPAGGGTVPVVGGELGKINTTALDHGDYTITLTVFPTGPGSPKTCTVTFTLLKVAVYITRVAGVGTVPSCFDETAELVSGMHIVPIGGGFHLDGAAYIYACTGRKVERYELRYTRVTAPGPGPLQPNTDDPIPVDWPVGNQLHTPLVYDPSKYWPWTEVGQMPTNLINDWGTLHVGAPSPGGTDYPILVPTGWSSYAATGNPGGGRYSLLLITDDTAGHRYYDLQRVWLDNWPVIGKLIKFQKPGATPDTWVDIPPCTDILLSWQKLRMIGLAWDPLIDSAPAWPTTTPNDNFNSYGLAYQKEFVLTSASIPITPTPDHPLLAPTRRVPDTLTVVPGPLPTDADANLLAEWDLTTLDAGSLPIGTNCETAPVPPDPNQLYRDCACTYTLSLSVSDNTVTETVGDYSFHHPSTSQPIKIVNDL